VDHNLALSALFLKGAFVAKYLETQPRRVALLLSSALGDSLVFCVIAHNLQRQGASVSVFGDQAVLLKAWLPDFEVLDTPGRAALPALLARFDLVLQLHTDRPFPDVMDCHPNVRVLSHVPNAATSAAMVTRLTEVCRAEWSIDDAVRSNGLRAPEGLVARRHANRVVIHPTASTADKCWLPSRFIQLGKALRQAGFDPQFILAPHERAAWAFAEREGMAMPVFASLGDVAAWIYESGWFIGNDSGIGHLASNLQIPTLSLFMRRGIARTWRPDFGSGKVLVGGTYIPTGRLKERYWKYALTVRAVMRAFAQLRAEVGESARRSE